VGAYCFAFNGKEIDNDGEWGQSTTAYDYGFRIYNPALARFLSVDPLTRSYPMLTPYQFASNSPVENIDLDGLEAFSIHGTASDPRAFDLMTDSDIKRLTGNSQVYREFTWPDGTNGFFNDQSDRLIAAQALADYVIENLQTGEDIGLIAHSHGGNVAIQAVAIIRERLNEVGDDRRINLITLATPAYNSPEDPENPANAPLDSHTHFYSSHDVVQTHLANAAGIKLAERVYESPATVNIRIEDEVVRPVPNVSSPGTYIVDPLPSPIYGPVESHSIQLRPELLVRPDSNEPR
jgi:RHS repeat-associated protein